MNMAMVKELRERTGVGFGDCKKALAEAGWDMDKAVDIVRLQSGAKAAKKADRTAAEGLLGLKVAADQSGAAGRRGAMVEVNVETDFAARNPKFAAFVATAVDAVLARGESAIADRLEADRQALVQEIGENVKLRRVARLVAPPNGTVVGYLHQDGRKGALVALAGGDEQLGRDLAMHVTAMRPLVVKGEDVPADVVARERAIFVQQAAESGKPPAIVEKMVSGRVRKFLAESSLVEQPFVKDANVKVGKLLADAKARCAGFVRFEVGEGIDKREEDFAAEVRKQLG